MVNNKLSELSMDFAVQIINLVFYSETDSHGSGMLQIISLTSSFRQSVKPLRTPSLEESHKKTFFLARCNITRRKAVSSSEASLISPCSESPWLEKKRMSAEIVRR